MSDKLSTRLLSLTGVNMIAVANVPYFSEGYIALHAVGKSHTCCSAVFNCRDFDFTFAHFVITENGGIQQICYFKHVRLMVS